MDAELFSFIWKGILLGIHAGISPGPVTTLLVTESLLHGSRAGMRIAFVPVLTDIPVICIIIPLLYYLTFDATTIIAVISMIGAFILCGLSYESFSVTESRYKRGDVVRVSLLKAVGTNFFNPNLYIYWITICGPLAVSGLYRGWTTMFSFLIMFYISITSVKLGLSLAVGNVRHSLNLKVIVWVNRFLGAAMLLFAVLFFWQGFQILTGEITVHLNKQ
ncbi:MAG: LysE family transporter [Planctomycetaceae bacterium]|jgi:threonine/homoserine/homoserine lactone efflux protein|nr:LysE family transporter [Planctomycetaceae bacterium]